MKYFSPDFLQFFIDLAPNNNKDWFDENRKRYETEVKEPFKKFVTDFIAKVNKVKPGVNIQAKDAIFRINRDIRFSKIKEPYKLHVSAIISPTGRKDKGHPGFYFEFSPDVVKFYGGIFRMDKDELYNVRSVIKNNLKEFESLIHEKQFTEEYSGITGEAHKRIPKEFKETFEKQPLIANKNFYFFKKVDPEVVLQDNLMDVLFDEYMLTLPLNNFFEKALKGK